MRNALILMFMILPAPAWAASGQLTTFAPGTVAMLVGIVAVCAMFVGIDHDPGQIQFDKPGRR